MAKDQAWINWIISISAHRKWLYQLLPIKYELKLSSKGIPGLLVIQIQIQTMFAIYLIIPTIFFQILQSKNEVQSTHSKL